MTDEEKEKEVKRAVEWKVFEVQASLLAEDVTEHHMALAKKWIQPVHYSEMVEERYIHGKCGFPTCKKSLVEKRPSSYRDIINSHSLAIARATNNAGGEVVFPSNYCSEDCFRKSSQFYGEMDRSAPVTRSGVSTLLASQSKMHSGGESNDHIYDMLNALNVTEPDDSLTKGSTLESAVSISPTRRPEKNIALEETVVPPLVNISRQGNSGSHQNRSRNQFTSPDKHKAESHSNVDIASVEENNLSTANELPSSPTFVKRPVNYIRPAPIPSSSTVVVDKSHKPASIKNVAVNRPNGNSLYTPTLVTDINPETETSSAKQTTAVTSQKNKSPSTSLVLPPSFQELWDAPTNSSNVTGESDSIAADMLRANSLLHTLATPSLLSYDPVTSSLPFTHTPLASSRRSDDVIAEENSIRTEDEAQRQAQLQSKEEEKCGTLRPSHSDVEESIRNPNVYIATKQAPQSLAPSSPRHAVIKASSEALPSLNVKSNQKNNPEAVKSILKVARNEISDDHAIVNGLEKHLTDLEQNSENIDKGTVRRQYINTSKSEFGIYDNNSDEETEFFDLDTDEEEKETIKKITKRVSEKRGDDNVGRPKIKLKPKAKSKNKGDHTRGRTEKKSITFGENSTVIFEKEKPVLSSSSETSLLFGPGPKVRSRNQNENNALSKRLEIVIEKATSRNTSDPADKTEQGRKYIDELGDETNASVKFVKYAELAHGHDDAPELDILMKHASDVPSVSEFEQILNAEEIAKLLAKEEEENVVSDGSFDDEIYGGDAGKKKGNRSSGRKGATDISQLSPQDRDRILVNKYRAEEEELYGSTEVAKTEDEETQVFAEVSRPFFSEQLEDWLEGCEWGVPYKGGVNEKCRINKAYPSSYATLLEEKKKYGEKGDDTIPSKVTDWDSQMARVKLAEERRKKKAEDEEKLKVDEKTARQAKLREEKAERKRQRAEAMKNDPGYLAKEKDRKERRKRLNREKKIKSLPAGISPSAALRQAAKLRCDQSTPKQCPPRPRPPPASFPPKSQSVVDDRRPSNWHPPPPPVSKNYNSSKVSNSVKSKHPPSSDQAMKIEIVEKPIDHSPEEQPMRGAVNSIEGYHPFSQSISTLVSEPKRINSRAEEDNVPPVLTYDDVDPDRVKIIPPQTDVHFEGDENTEDEKIWKEIFGDNAKLPGSDVDDEDAILDVKDELNSILSQNFFIYLWTTLEDMFGDDVTSWMNSESLSWKGNVLTKVGPVDTSCGDNSFPDANRPLLSAATQNAAHSIATLLFRAVHQAEKTTGIASLFASDSSKNNAMRPIFSSVEFQQYHEAKQALLSRANIRRVNPAFNSMQWNVLGLILVDALLMRKVLGLRGDYSPSFVHEVPQQSAVDHHSSIEIRSEMWNLYFCNSLQEAVGGKDVLDGLLEPRELQNLRCFFNLE